MNTSYQPKEQPNLSSREIEIVRLIVDEYSTKEIAEMMYLSFETIKTYRKNIMVKLRAKNVAGIVRGAFLYNILSLYSNNRFA
jgi:DNA-binding CsgD family transcriptional regulator